MRVVSYNIRTSEYNKHDQGERHWNARKEHVINRIKELKPDVFGTQEGSIRQNEFIKEQLPEFDFYGTSRDEDKLGEMCPVFYNKNKFTLIDSKTFWLSETPDVPSKSFGAHYPRICTYLILKRKETDKQFLVANVHLDHVKPKTREEQIKVAITQLSKHNLPIIIMGDFNSGFNTKPYKLLKKLGLYDTYMQNKGNPPRDSKILSFHGYTQKSSTIISGNGRFRIDWIFVSKDFKTIDAGIRTDKKNEEIASDHYPIFAELEL